MACSTLRSMLGIWSLMYFNGEDYSERIAEDAPEYAAMNFEQTEDEFEKDWTQHLQKYSTMRSRMKRTVNVAPSAACVCAMPDPNAQNAR